MLLEKFKIKFIVQSEGPLLSFEKLIDFLYIEILFTLIIIVEITMLD